MFSRVILVVSVFICSLAQAYEVEKLTTTSEFKSPWMMADYTLVSVHSSRLGRKIAFMKQYPRRIRADYLFEVYDGQLVNLSRLDVHMVEPAVEALEPAYGQVHTVHYTTFDGMPYALVGMSHHARPLAGNAAVSGGSKFGGASLEGIPFSAFVLVSLSDATEILKVYEVDDSSADFYVQRVIHEFAYYELSRRFKWLCLGVF